MTQTDRVPRGAALAIVGSALLVLAALLPWAGTTAQPHESGFDLVDGYVTFGVGVVVGVLALPALVPDATWNWRGRVPALVGGLAVVGLALRWYRGILTETGLAPRYGLHATLVAGLLLLTAAVVGLRDG